MDIIHRLYEDVPPFDNLLKKQSIGQRNDAFSVHVTSPLCNDHGPRSVLLHLPCVWNHFCEDVNTRISYPWHMMTSSNGNVFRVFVDPFVWGIYHSPVISHHKGQGRGALMFPLMCASTNGCTNNGDADDFRRHRPHYDVTVGNYSAAYFF